MFKDARPLPGLANARLTLFAQLVDSSPANVMVVDMQMRLLAINRTARQTFIGLNLPVPVFGESFRDYPPIVPEAKAQLVGLWERALAGEVFIENVAMKLPPSERHFEMRFDVVRDPHGALTGAYVFGYDISERVAEQARLREAEQALRNAQKMEAVGQLTGGIAHDFNNLLGSISAAVELAGARLAEGRADEVGNLLTVAGHNTARAAQLVQRLLAFARHQALQPQPTDVHALVHGMRALVLTSLGDHIELLDLTQANQWLTCVDPSQLENALLNLCLNARDAMPGGGTLSIGCSNVSLTAPQAQALHLAPGDYLQLKVIDSGSGMTAQVAAQALNPFFTTKPLGQGTGLGLSMVYGFARQSGGQVDIRSRPGRGTEVRVYLPRHAAPAPLRMAPGVPASAPGELPSGRRVMLVEDQRSLRLVVEEVLQDQGYQVTTFETGVAASEALGQGPAPHLLITDIGLPGGLDGRQLALQAMARDPQLRVLFITGYDPLQTLAEFALTPRVASISKPFALGALLDSTQRLLCD